MEPQDFIMECKWNQGVAGNNVSTEWVNLNYRAVAMQNCYPPYFRPFKSIMDVAIDQQCDPLRFFKCWHLYPYLACHVTKTKKGLKVRQNMPDIVDTALLVLNQCSLQCYRWIFQTSAYFGNCCITRGRCDTFS